MLRGGVLRGGGDGSLAVKEAAEAGVERGGCREAAAGEEGAGEEESEGGRSEEEEEEEEEEEVEGPAGPCAVCGDGAQRHSAFPPFRAGETACAASLHTCRL